jgi:hypothetical protein
MQLLLTWYDVKAALARFAFEHGAGLPSALGDRFIAATSNVSDVDNCVQVAELLYANRALIDAGGHRDAAMTLAGQLAAFAGQPGQALHGFADPIAPGGLGRGQAILFAMARELGEDAPAGGWPDPADDPTPAATSVLPADG